MLLRPCPVQRYIVLMKNQGIGIESLISGTRIDADRLEESNYLIELEDLERFLTNMIRLSDRQGLGLDLGLQQEAAHYGILAYTGLSCHSILEGIEDIWSRYGQTFGVMSKLRVTNSSEVLAAVSILPPFRDQGLQRFCVEEALCILYRIGGLITNEEPQFESLKLSYAPPSYAQRYSDIFNCPVNFNCAESMVQLRRDWLEKPLMTSDAELNKICRQHLEHVLVSAGVRISLEQRLRQFLLETEQPLPTLEGAAREFRISPRTLSRRLGEQGTSYRELMNDVRKELACRWLGDNVLVPKEISYRLGFSDVAAFRRAFKKWTGSTPGDYAKQIAPI